MSEQQSKQQQQQYTSGPWFTTHGDYPDDHLVCELRIAIPKEAGLNMSERGARYAANERLAVAAPDMLSALENLVIAIGMGCDLDGVVEVATNVIAKATVQQKVGEG